MFHSKEITSLAVWEEFIKNSTSIDYPFFQGWNWGEVLKKLSVPVTRMGYYQEDTLVAVLQFVEVKAKRGHYLYLRHGPILTSYSSDLVSFILSEIKTYAKQKSASFIRISRFPSSEEASTFFKKMGFITSALQTSDAEVCWILDITK